MGELDAEAGALRRDAPRGGEAPGDAGLVVVGIEPEAAVGDAAAALDAGRLDRDHPGLRHAQLIQCWRCQSVGEPSSAEYWHIGATAMRLGTVMGPTARGEKSAEVMGNPGGRRGGPPETVARAGETRQARARSRPLSFAGPFARGRGLLKENEQGERGAMAKLRQLVAGNWKMNGTAASLAEIDAVKAGIGGRDLRRGDLPAGDADRPGRGAGRRLGADDRRPGLPPEGQRRPYRRHFGRDDRRCRRKAGDRRPFRAPGRPQGERTSWSAPRPRPAGGPGCSSSSASARPRRSGRRGRPTRCCRSSSRGRCRRAPRPPILVIAYEPVWAIGTGLTASNDDIAAAHAHIRARLAERFGDGAKAIRILYGGSVKPSNAAEILKLDDVDGALVGGASLKAADFLAIVAAAK